MRIWMQQTIENEGVGSEDAQRSVISPLGWSCVSKVLSTDSKAQLIDSKWPLSSLAEARHPLSPVLDAGASR